MAVWEGLAKSSKWFRAIAHVFTEPHVSINLSIEKISPLHNISWAHGVGQSGCDDIFLEESIRLFHLFWEVAFQNESKQRFNWTSSLFWCLSSIACWGNITVVVFYIILKYSTYNVVTMAKTGITMVIFCTIRDSRTVQ